MHATSTTTTRRRARRGRGAAASTSTRTFALLVHAAAALAPLLGGQGRVRTLQVLTRPAAEAVAAALDRARGTTESRPTNNMSYATSDVGVAVPRTADGPASLLVDEAGLGDLFDALAETVVAPLARLLFPAFPPMDSAMPSRCTSGLPTPTPLQMRRRRATTTFVRLA